MPIRSPRGRAAAYRAVWQWPLRSPARLAFTLVMLGALVFALVYAGGQVGGGASSGGLLAGGGSDEQRWDPGGSGVSATPTPTMLPPVPALTPESLSPDRASPQALEVARVWASAWVNHPDGMTAQQWAAGLRPYTTDEFLGVLANVDPANIPASRVTGPATPTRAASKSVEVEVPTDTVRLTILVVDTDAGWKVSRYDRA